jgi:hypothetical protein
VKLRDAVVLAATLLLEASASAGVEPLPAKAPIGGVVWSVVVPGLLFVTALGATWLLFRHFAGRDRSG